MNGLKQRETIKNGFRFDIRRRKNTDVNRRMLSFLFFYRINLEFRSCNLQEAKKINNQSSANY